MSNFDFLSVVGLQSSIVLGRAVLARTLTGGGCNGRRSLPTNVISCITPASFLLFGSAIARAATLASGRNSRAVR